MDEVRPGAKLKTRARISGHVIRGPSGIHGEPGSVEPLDMTEPGHQVVELDYQTAVAMLGQDTADQLFRLAEGGESSE